MTTFQIVSLAALAIVLCAQYVGPQLAKTKLSAMTQIEQVIAIRDSSTNPEVVSACKALLQALLM